MSGGADLSEDITDKQYKRNGFFLVREEILPEAIKKTIKVKEMLKQSGFTERHIRKTRIFMNLSVPLRPMRKQLMGILL